MTQHTWKRRDLTGDGNGFNHVYLMGGEVEFTDYVMTMETEVGITGEYAGGVGVSYAQVAHVAEGFGMDCEIHAPGHAPRHCMAAIRNSNYDELGLVNPKIAGWKSQHRVPADGYSDKLDAVDRHGRVPVPQGPGLGANINRTVSTSTPPARRITSSRTDLEPAAQASLPGPSKDKLRVPTKALS